MFFKEATVWKAYSTEAAALRWIAKNMPNREDIRVEFCGSLYMVVSG